MAEVSEDGPYYPPERLRQGLRGGVQFRQGLGLARLGTGLQGARSVEKGAF
jgi:hypothetical protein